MDVNRVDGVDGSHGANDESSKNIRDKVLVIELQHEVIVRRHTKRDAPMYRAVKSRIPHQRRDIAYRDRGEMCSKTCLFHSVVEGDREHRIDDIDEDEDV